MASGTRSLLNEVLTLGAMAGALALGVAHFDKLKPMIGEMLPLVAEGNQDRAGAQAAVPAEDANRPSGTVELKAGDNGHYHTEAEINGRPVEVMVDTGASLVALSYRDAERAGIFLRASDFTHQVNTANGVAKVAPVMLDRVSIGDITVHNVKGVVAEDGDLEVTLLGMSFLSRLERVDMRAGTLILAE